MADDTSASRLCVGLDAVAHRLHAAAVGVDGLDDAVPFNAGSEIVNRRSGSGVSGTFDDLFTARRY